MSEAGRAVFLSYASQDVDAARRICEALRAGGVEVWFDQSELRGGDEWNQHIRQQIRECALFVPIISATTQSRLEGYFRREWRLGVDRTLDMADGKPFIVPVAIDDTPDRNAHVPDAFRAVQWTRLPAGETPAAFVDRVKRLLSGESPVPTLRTAPPPRDERRDAPVRTRLISSKPLRLGLIAIALGYFVFGWWRGNHDAADAPPPAPPATPGSATKAAAGIADKSIAVLPFVDMSEKRDQEYFSDGLAEELLNLLAKVPDLQVIARTSSFSFKGTSDDIPTIAKKLSVAHILEGSVRKSGRRMRITTQLVRADNGAQVWSETYDRDVEDVFKVQDDIARIVVEKLKGTLLAGAPVTARTTNPESHSLYLQAQYYRALDTEEALESARVNYERALKLDPDYAPAWSGLSAAYSRILANGGKAGDPRIPLARKAAENSIRLDPHLGEAYSTLAFLDMMVDFAFQKAGESLARGRELDPGNPTVLYVSGVYSRTMGREAAAIEFFEQALQRDPVNLLTRRYYARALLHAHRVADAEKQARKLLEISPSFPAGHYTLCLVLLEKGDGEGALAAITGETAPSWRVLGMPLGLYAAGRTQALDAALAAMVARGPGSEFQYAEAYAYVGRKEEAFQWLDAAATNRDPGIIWTRGDPLLRSLEGDPRYTAFMRKAHLTN